MFVSANRSPARAEAKCVFMSRKRVFVIYSIGLAKQELYPTADGHLERSYTQNTRIYSVRKTRLTSVCF